MTQLRRLCAAAMFLAAVLATPSHAASATTLSGTAGSYVTVTVAHQVVVDYRLSAIRSLTADRGSFVGFAMVGAHDGPMFNYLNGRHANSSCAFGKTCYIDDWPEASGPQRNDDSGYVIAAGTYRFALLGAEGAKLKLTSTLPFLAHTTVTNRHGRMTVRSLASTTPPVGDVQPHADGAAGFEAGGLAITGVVFRLDAAYAKEASIDLCVGSGSTVLPAAASTCEMGQGGESEGAGVFYEECGDPLPVFLCIPASTEPVSVIHGIAAVVSGGSHASFDLDVKAVKSRTLGWAFTFRF